MGKTRDLFKKIRDTKGTLHAKMGLIKDRKCLDLTEAEEIKKRWQEYTEELYKKDLHDPDNHFFREDFLGILCNSAYSWVYLSLYFFAICFSFPTAMSKACSDNYFAFLKFFSFGMILVTASCIMLQISVHSSSGTLSTRSKPLNLLVTSMV